MNNIPVVFISDDDYIIPTTVAIQSMIHNMKDSTNYIIYIIAPKLQTKSIEMVSKFESKNVQIKIISVNLDKYESIGNDRGEYCQATKVALFKFDIPNLLAEHDKAIYLDGDIIVRKDLKALFNIDIEKYYVAAVNDSGKMYSHRKIMQDMDTYFNSGVMLLNLKLMREHDITSKLIYQKTTMTDSTLMDQDVFNIVLRQKVKLIPIKYNFLYINLIRAQETRKFEIDDLNKLYSTHYLSLDDIRKDAVVIHFASKNKPWKDDDVKLHFEWKSYFDASPACEETEYLYIQQIKWLKNENNRNIKQISRQKKKMIELEKKQVQLEYNLSEIRKSFTYKLARVITSPVQVARKVLKAIKEKTKYNKYKVIKLNGLNKEKREIPIIVSLTTYGKRLKTVDITIGTILRQTVKPDKIVVVVSEDDAKKITLRLKLLSTLKLIEILPCEDLKSPHMKYFFTMQKYRDSLIVTVDDDIIYRNNLIEKLYKSYQKHPNCVSALRVHRIRIDSKGMLKSYNDWKLRDSKYVDEPRNDLFATGVGGVLYPPNLLYKDIFDLSLIKKYSLKADDIWLKVMELLSDTKVVLADVQQRLIYIDNTQDMGLFNTNVFENANDIQFNNLIEYYKEYDLINRIRN